MWSVTIPKELRDRETDLLKGVNVWKVCRYVGSGNVRRDVDSLTVRNEICCELFFETAVRKRTNLRDRENYFRQLYEKGLTYGIERTILENELVKLSN